MTARDLLMPVGICQLELTVSRFRLTIWMFQFEALCYQKSEAARNPTNGSLSARNQGPGAMRA